MYPWIHLSTSKAFTQKRSQFNYGHHLRTVTEEERDTAQL